VKKYEALFIIKPDLSQEDQKALFNQIREIVAKNNGNVSEGSLWPEKRKLYFPLKRYREGIYYLLQFAIEPKTITDINHAYKLNENILRVLIIKLQ